MPDKETESYPRSSKTPQEYESKLSLTGVGLGFLFFSRTGIFLDAAAAIVAAEAESPSVGELKYLCKRL